MTLTVRWAAKTDVGKARDRNEDSYYGGEHVFAVADGLGGHNAGDVASRIAIEPMKALDGRITGEKPERIAEMLAESVSDANRAVFKRAQQDAKVRGMGTTLTAVAVVDGSVHLAHVGDSRCYLIRDGAMTQLSSDHTLVARMVQEGKLTPEQAEVHPQRSILTRALGAESEVEVDSLQIELIPGDRLLLCSDGLSSVIGDDAIRTVLSDATDLDAGCKRLIAEANAHGGPDNITVIVVEVTGTAPPRRATPSGDGRVTRAPAAREPKKGRRRLPVRLLMWAAVAMIILIGVVIGVRSWADRSYYVGLSGDEVTIFRGLPTEVVGLKLHRVQETTGIKLEQVSEFFRENLRVGIRADSLAKARQVVAKIPLANPPGPSPSPTPTPTST
jgi:PPM family protein phosphatase